MTKPSPDTETFSIDTRHGVPDAVRDHVVAQSYPRSWRVRYVAYQATSIVLILSVPTGVGIALFQTIAWLEAKRTEGGYFSAENHGWSVVILGFGLLFATAWVASAAPAVAGERVTGYVAVRAMTSEWQSASAAGQLGAALSRWLYRRASRRTATAAPAAFLRELQRAQSRAFMWPALLFMVLGLFAVVVDFQAYAVGTRSGVDRHSLFGASSLPWSSLQSVHFGCAERTKGGKPFTLYELQFEGGEKITALLHPTRSAIERLAELDPILRARGVPIDVAVYTGGRYAGQQIWTDGCLDALAVATGTEPHLLERIFRPSGGTDP